MSRTPLRLFLGVAALLASAMVCTWWAQPSNALSGTAKSEPAPRLMAFHLAGADSFQSMKSVPIPQPFNGLSSGPPSRMESLSASAASGGNQSPFHSGANPGTSRSGALSSLPESGGANTASLVSQSAAFPPTPAPPPEIEPVDPEASGALLTVDGRQVRIEAYQLQPGGGAPALHVAIPSAGEGSPEAVGGILSPSASVEPSSQANLAPTEPTASQTHPQAGFSLEEERFRTRWGCAAYDAVRRAAMESTGETP